MEVVDLTEENEGDKNIVEVEAGGDSGEEERSAGSTRQEHGSQQNRTMSITNLIRSDDINDTELGSYPPPPQRSRARRQARSSHRPRPPQDARNDSTASELLAGVAQSLSGVIDLSNNSPTAPTQAAADANGSTHENTANDDELEIVSWTQHAPNGPSPDGVETNYNSLPRIFNSVLNNRASSNTRQPRPRRSIPARAHAHVHQGNFPDLFGTLRTDNTANTRTTLPALPAFPARPNQPYAGIGPGRLRLPPIDNRGLPGLMDYDMTAFNLGQADLDGDSDFDIVGLSVVDPSEDMPAGTTRTQLLPLAPTREGFTRDPRPGDECICANCESTLTDADVPTEFQETGSAGDDEKVKVQQMAKEVWATRECGHVYCGLCACPENRGVRLSGKGKARIQPSPFEIGYYGRKALKVCAVDNCKCKLVSRKAVFQIYL